MVGLPTLYHSRSSLLCTEVKEVGHTEVKLNTKSLRHERSV